MSYYGPCPVCKRQTRSHYPEKVDPSETCKCDPKEKSEHDLDSFVDWRGNTVEVGDTIVYPFLSGRSAGLAVGEVLRIHAKASWSGWEPRLKVMPLERNWDRTSDKVKPSTLMFHDRAILLEKTK